MKYSIFIALMFSIFLGYTQKYENDLIYPYSVKLIDTSQYDFSFLDTTVASYDAFFVGDSHGYYSDVAVQFQLLMYLYKSAGVRYYVCERGVGGGYALDKFVIDGDSTYYKYTLDAGWEWEDRFLFYDNIRKFNKKKTELEKIRIFGVDFEYTKNIELLKIILLKHKEIPKKIKSDVTSLLQYDHGTDRSYWKEYRKFLHQFGQKLLTNEMTYQLYLKEDFYDFKRIVTNPNNKSRSDKNTLSNVMDIVNHNKEKGRKGKYFFHYGFGHSVLNRKGLLGTYLNNSPHFKGKVFTFLPYYVESVSKYGSSEKKYKERWGATIDGNGYKRSKLFDSFVGTIDQPGFKFVDLRKIPKKEVGKKGLAGQYLIIHYKSRAIE